MSLVIPEDIDVLMNTSAHKSIHSKRMLFRGIGTIVLGSLLMGLTFGFLVAPLLTDEAYLHTLISGFFFFSSASAGIFLLNSRLCKEEAKVKVVPVKVDWAEAKISAALEALKEAHEAGVHKEVLNRLLASLLQAYDLCVFTDREEASLEEQNKAYGLLTKIKKVANEYCWQEHELNSGKRELEKELALEAQDRKEVEVQDAFNTKYFIVESEISFLEK